MMQMSFRRGSALRIVSQFVTKLLGHTNFVRLSIGNYIKKAHSAFAKWALGHLRLELAYNWKAVKKTKHRFVLGFSTVTAYEQARLASY